VVKKKLKLDFNSVIFKRVSNPPKHQVTVSSVVMYMTRTDISEFEISMNKYEYTIDPTHKGKVYIYKRGV
jgi:hypothetical protein